MRELTFSNKDNGIYPRKPQKDEGLLKRNYLLFITHIASLGALCVGTCIGWSSNVIFAYSHERFPLTIFGMTAESTKWLITIFSCGATVSPLLILKCWKFIGSRKSILIACCFLMTSWIALFLWINPVLYMVSRFLAGLSVGCFNLIIPIYIEDINPLEKKNYVHNIWNIYTVIGILLNYIPNFFGNIILSNILPAVLAATVFIIFFCLPESPRYLCSKGQQNAAKDVLRKYHEIDEDIENEIHNWSSKDFNDYSIVSLFKGSSRQFNILIAFGLIIFEHFIGIWVIYFYITWIFNIINDSNNNYMESQFATILVTCAFLAGCILMEYFKKNFNEKKFLVITSLLQGICLIILGTFLHLQGAVMLPENKYELIPYVSLSLYAIFYAMGLYRLIWKYIKLLMPNSLYFTTRAVLSSFNWLILSILTINYVGLVEMAGIGWSFYFMALASLLLSIFVAVFLPKREERNCSKLDWEDNSDISEVSSEGSKTPIHV